MEGILNDANKDGIPDSIKNTTPEKQKDILSSFKQSFDKILDSGDIVRRPDKQIVDITFDENAVNAFEQKMKGILDGLACGFG